jgi:hypothetical protein
MAKKTIIYYLVMAMVIIGIAQPVEAALSPSQAISMAAVDRTGDLQRIRTVLETKVVAQRLQDLGFTHEEITTRLSEMSDQHIHSIAQKLDDLKVGKDGLGVVIAVLLIIALVIVIINLTTGQKVAVTK